MPPPPPIKFLMYGVQGVGKSTMRTAMTNEGRIIENYAPTETVTYDTGRYMNQEIRILDFSGSKEGQEALLGDVTNFQDLAGFCFFFNAENIYRKRDYMMMDEMLKLFMVHCRYAVGHIFLHRTEKIEEGKDDEMWRTLVKNVYKHRKKICPEWVKFYFHMTSIYRPETIPYAWQRVCESLVKIPHKWEHTVRLIGENMQFKQVVVLDRTQPFIVSNYAINSKMVLDEDECKKRAKEWFDLGRFDDAVLTSDKFTFIIRLYHYHTIFVGIKSTKKNAELDLNKIQRQWHVLNTPFDLNKKYIVSDYSDSAELTMFNMPDDWAKKFKLIGEACAMAQVFVFDENLWTLVHQETIEEDGAFKLDEWSEHVLIWRQSLETREMETNGRRIFIQKFVSGTVLIMVTKDASVTPYLVKVNLSIAQKKFEGKLQLILF